MCGKYSRVHSACKHISHQSQHINSFSPFSTTVALKHIELLSGNKYPLKHDKMHEGPSRLSVQQPAPADQTVCYKLLTVVTAHVMLLELRTEESSKDHLGRLPVMWLDILSRSPIPFALFTEKYPHDTSSKLSRQKYGPNPPCVGIQRNETSEIFTTQFHSWIKITYLNLELGQALRLCPLFPRLVHESPCVGQYLRLAWKGAFNPIWSPSEYIRCWFSAAGGTMLPALWFPGTLRKILFDVSGSSVSKKQWQHKKLHREMQSQDLCFRKFLPWLVSQ